MTRHLVAVCVFCLLCAEHFPCKGHSMDHPNVADPQQQYNPRDSRVLFLNAQHQIVDSGHDHMHDHDSSKPTVVQEERKRLKRHAPAHGKKKDDSGDHVKKNSQQFLDQIMEHYGDTTTNSMSVTEFEAMLQQLGLNNLLRNQPRAASCKADSLDVITKMTRHPALRESHGRSRHDYSRHDHEDDDDEREDYHRDIDISNWRLDTDAIWNICPLVLNQLTSVDPLEKTGCVLHELTAPDNYMDHFDGEEHESNRVLVWVYSFITILGVSACGLLGVGVVPFMDKHFYHHAIQFFVALAIGTLCGDALLHLVPHSMIAATEMSHDEAHTYMMWKGLTAVMGIIFFYFVERTLTIIAGRWAKRQKNGKPPSKNLNVIRDPESNVAASVALSDKQCKHKYSSSPYCYNEIAMESRDEAPKVTADEEKNHHMNHLNHNNTVYKTNSCPKHGEHGDHVHDSEQKLLDTTNASNNQYTTISDNYKNLCNSFAKDEETTASVNDNASVEGAKVPLQGDNYTIILREHQTKHHGHSHTHGHVHAPPESLSAVAWMVVMGDGLHNFTDGMAIGAAFSNNIAGGFSTAIAVFCHELPHELGDFAVLLKAGMPLKQAVFYNILSSVLSIFGMIVGVIVGDTPEASAWIFAAAAGMFLYIALVDMIPELTSSHGKEERCQFSESILQFLGMTVGFGVMVLISLYEHDLKKMFTSDHHHH